MGRNSINVNGREQGLDQALELALYWAVEEYKETMYILFTGAHAGTTYIFKADHSYEIASGPALNRTKRPARIEYTVSPLGVVTYHKNGKALPDWSAEELFSPEPLHADRA